MTNTHIFRILMVLMLSVMLTVPVVLAENRIFIEPVNIQRGETLDLPLILDNDQTFYGFQLDMTLPEGLEVDNQGGILHITRTDRLDDSYSIIGNVLDNGVIRMGAFSSTHTPISGNSGAISFIKIKACDNFQGGSIVISEIMCISENDKDIPFNGESTYIGVFISVESITLSQESAELKVGESISLTATVYPENATDKTVTWTSDNASVASVDGNGNVTAMSLGNAVISAKSGNVSASCVISVIATPAENITLSQESAELKVGESISLTATVYPENATDKTVTWTSDNASVASVDGNGNVTAKSLGNAVITAKCGNVSASCAISVIATPAESITLSRESAELKVGESLSLTATIYPENATDKTVTWTSDNASVASVDGNGNVTAKSLGNAVITAKCGNVSSSCSIFVIATPAESITLSQESAELKVGESISLTATVYPEDATDKTVTWTSDNASVASVDGNGNVTAMSLGYAVISAKCGNVSSSCSIFVIATPAESITLSRESAELKVGESISLIATVYPEDATDKTVTWTSDNASVASVDGNGNVTAMSLGNAVISAKCGNVFASCTVIVLPVLAESITISPESWTGEEGNSFKIDVTIMPETTTDKTIVFESSDKDIAIVDDEGFVSVIKEGNCIITVSTLDGSNLSAICQITGLAGIENLFSDTVEKVDVFNINGILLKKNFSIDELRLLPPAIYIVRSKNVVKTLYIGGK